MNNYFVLDNPFVPGTLIRAEEVNEKLTEIEVGFEGVELDTTRSIRLPAGDDGDFNFNAATRAGRVIGFNALGVLELQAAFKYQGDFLTATLYQKNHVYRDPVSKNLYIVNVDHTSTSVAADLAGGQRVSGY